ncbi:MAG: peptide deformylase [Verrucomicrobiota bacterium]
MVLSIVKYGHPVLRKKGARIERIDPHVKKLIANMLETMKAAHGVGLAAQQVGEALQLTVIDIRGVTERPSTLKLDGKDADPESIMPLILINPELKTKGESVAGPEGCLSFPEIFADIKRPESVHVRAMNEKGETVEFECGGLLSRAVQHETDHLNGILYIDRMDRETKANLRAELEELQAQTKAELKKELSDLHRRAAALNPKG